MGAVFFTAFVALIVGAVGGTLSGWYRRPLLVCLGGTLAACGAAILILEVTSDNAITKNFWPNLEFFASCAVIPLVFGYLAAHLVGVGRRKGITFGGLWTKEEK
jgi:ribose/xylose/arabinose/galactoside ABC-type transport system permease subunit